MLLGTSYVSITPDNPIGIPMGGYGARNKTCSGVADELMASIFYLEIKKQPIYLTNCERSPHPLGWG